MRKVLLKMNEQQKYEVIKRLVYEKGNKKRAALTLGISLRHINRLIKKYKSEGKAGFAHKNRNRPSANSLSQELVNQIIDLYKGKYQGYNFSHFLDKLIEDENINISYKCLYDLLNKHNIYSPIEHHSTRRKRKRDLIKALKPKADDKTIELILTREIALEDAHPRKSRVKNFGELIQIDASIHRWFGDNKVALHLAIDNATGIIVGGYFAKQETLNGYYHVYKQILEDYGIPFKFLSDNRMVFKSPNNTEDPNSALTQFAYACKRFGTSIETSSISQYKGQIERANGTFQRRLINELKTERINDFDKANKYLIDVFIPDFNKKFGMDIDKFDSVMDTIPSQEMINLTLAIITERKFDNGSSIKYKNNIYQAFDKDGNIICFKPKTNALVMKCFDNKLFVTVEDKIYALVQLEKNKKYSEEFDMIEDEKEVKRVYIPPMSHPWKRASFLAFVQKNQSRMKYV